MIPLGQTTGKTAGTAGGAYACTQAGAPSAASLCGKFGGKIGARIESEIANIMSSGAQQAAEQAQLSAAIHAQYEAQQELNAVLNFVILELSQATGFQPQQVAQALLDNGVALSSDPDAIDPHGVWPLATGGSWHAKTVASSYPYYAPAFWRAIVWNELGKFSPARWSRLQDGMNAWSHELEYGAVAAAAELEGLELGPFVFQRRLDPDESTSRAAVLAKNRSAVLWAAVGVVAAGAAGVAYHLWNRRR